MTKREVDQICFDHSISMEVEAHDDELAVMNKYEEKKNELEDVETEIRNHKKEVRKLEKRKTKLERQMVVLNEDNKWALKTIRQRIKRKYLVYLAEQFAIENADNEQDLPEEVD